jgi:hypothetical protein
MKTTRSTKKTPANLSIVTLVCGDEWVKLSTSKGQLTAWLENSEGAQGSVSLEQARDRMATLLGAGWTAKQAA